MALLRHRGRVPILRTRVLGAAGWHIPPFHPGRSVWSPPTTEHDLQSRDNVAVRRRSLRLENVQCGFDVSGYCRHLRPGICPVLAFCRCPGRRVVCSQPLPAGISQRRRQPHRRPDDHRMGLGLLHDGSAIRKSPLLVPCRLRRRALAFTSIIRHASPDWLCW